MFLGVCASGVSKLASKCPGYDYIAALTMAGVDTLRCRREELTRRFFTRPT